MQVKQCTPFTHKRNLDAHLQLHTFDLGAFSCFIGGQCKKKNNCLYTFIKKGKEKKKNDSFLFSVFNIKTELDFCYFV